MAATFHTAPHSNTGSFGQGLSTRLAERFAQYRTYRTTVSELAMLTDRELTDMGMHRSDIRDIAFEAAYKA